MMLQRVGVTVCAAALLLSWCGADVARGETEGESGVSAVMGTGFTYQGRLEDGGAPADGVFDFIFSLYASRGDPEGPPERALTYDLVSGVTVAKGLFTARVDLGGDWFDGSALWVQVAVKRPSQAGYTALWPRQAVTPAPYALYSASAAAASAAPAPTAHDHWGEMWSGSGTGLRLSSSDGSGFYAESTFSNGVYATSTAATGKGVYGVATSPTGPSTGVWGQSASSTGRGVVGWASSPEGNSCGVFGMSNSPTGRAVGGLVDSPTGETYGVYGESISDTGSGVYGNATCVNGSAIGVTGVSKSTDGWGVHGHATATSGPACGVYGRSESDNGCGVYGETDRDGTIPNKTAGVHGHTDGEGPDSFGVMGSCSTGGAALYGYNSAAGSALRVISHEGHPIDAYSTYLGINRVFYVTASGNVCADGEFTSGGADFAEMLPAGEGLEAGDVLVVGEDGKLARSSEPEQSSVVGVYSTKPGFVGGSEGDESVVGRAPLAVMGIVPVKAVSENGPIRPGDLLVTSSSAGRAMKAGDLPKIGTVIGKALGRLDGEAGTIRMLVMLQ